jgi:hypothetical protein
MFISIFLGRLIDSILENFDKVATAGKTRSFSNFIDIHVGQFQHKLCSVNTNFKDIVVNGLPRIAFK